MTATQVLITVIVLVLFAIVVVGGWLLYRRWSLHKRFGPEYDRLIEEKGTRADAERELRAREHRHNELELRPLTEEAHRTYSLRWEEIQAQFLDEPGPAVDKAAALVTELVAERGYPAGDYDEQLSQLSVEHAKSLEHYRAAHDIATASARGEAPTEQLRQAMVHYRALLADLLGGDVTGTTPPNSDHEPSHP
jgi:hypothetical protein